jgi:hypothetical protein
MEDLEIDDNYYIGVSEINDGEVICLFAERHEELTEEILMTRESAISLALLILELTGYEEENS